jgi:hypothetical protein
MTPSPAFVPEPIPVAALLRKNLLDVFIIPSLFD